MLTHHFTTFICCGMAKSITVCCLDYGSKLHSLSYKMLLFSGGPEALCAHTRVQVPKADTRHVLVGARKSTALGY